jgi:voltage-gated potassium channel Kch
LDLNIIAEQPLLIVGLAIVLVAVKAGLIMGVARLFGVATPEALKLGLLLSQGGEFAFVLFGAGVASALISPAAVSLYSAVVTLSMITTPFLMKVYDHLDRRRSVPEPDGLEGPDVAPPGKAIVIGYGRFGQTVSQLIMAKGIDVVLIDSKPSQIETSGDFGMKVYYGDGMRIDLLRQAGAQEARMLLFCIDGDALDAKRLEPILEAFPQAQVFVRAFDRRHVMALEGVDVAGVYREVFESAVCMGREALGALGIDSEEVDRIARAYRERDSSRLARQSSSGDIKADKHTIFRPGEELGDEEGAQAVG